MDARSSLSCELDGLGVDDLNNTILIARESLSD
jgi:hypothetical protein